MKKNLILVVCVLLLMTGCGSDNNERKLECTREYDGVSIKDTYSYDENDKLISVTRENTYNKSYKNYTSVEEQIDTLKNSAEERGIDFKVTRESDSITLITTYTNDNLEDFNNQVNGITERNPEEVKSIYEEVGGTCK